MLRSSLLLILVLFASVTIACAATPFIGRWALTIPGGAAGWLGIEEKDGALRGSILWSGGSVLPVQGVKVEGDTLTVTRVSKSKNTKTNTEEEVTETITATVAGDDLKLTTVKT